MPDFLALDWDQHRICGIEAQVTKGFVQVKSLVQFDWPGDIDPHAHPADAGARLKTELNRAGVSAEHVLLSLPREDVIVRHLELPKAPDEELPELVRFQAASKSSLPLDKLIIDYVPLPPRESSAGRDVLMSTLTVIALGKARAMMSAAGRELKSVGVSSLAAGEIIARADATRKGRSEGAALTVVRFRDRVEISVVHDRHVLFTHATRITAGNGTNPEQPVCSEVSRALVAFDKMQRGVSIDHMWVLGGEGDEGIASLCTALSERFGQDVEQIDPLSLKGIALPRTEVPGSRALYAGPLGMLLAQSDQLVESVDFLVPRKPVVQMDRTRLKLGIAAAAALVVMGIGLGARQLYVNKLDRDISALDGEAELIKNAVADGTPLLASSDQIDGWSHKNVNWLDQMQEILAATPGTRDIYMLNWTFDSGRGDSMGKFAAELRTRTDNDANMLMQDLSDMGNYKVQPPTMQRSPDLDYPISFQLIAELRSPPKPLGETGSADTRTAPATGRQ